MARPTYDMPVIPMSEWPKEDGYYWCLVKHFDSWIICELTGAGTARTQLWSCGDDSAENEYVVAFGERVSKGA